MDIFNHFEKIENFIKFCKTSDRQLLHRINNCKSKKLPLIHSIASVCELIIKCPWISEQQLYDQCCFSSKQRKLFEELLELCNVTQYTILNEKKLILKNEKVSIEIFNRCKIRFEFANALIKGVQQNFKFCYFGFHKIVIGEIEWQVRLMWALCNHCTMDEKQSFMISMDVSNSTDVSNIEEWILNVAATFNVHDENRLLNFKRCAVYNDLVHNFGLDLINVQSIIQPHIFNKAIDELDPFTDQMKSDLMNLFEKHKMDKHSIATFIEGTYLKFDNFYLQSKMESYFAKMKTIVDSNGYCF
jgi:hypothetical protein